MGRSPRACQRDRFGSRSATRCARSPRPPGPLRGAATPVRRAARRHSSYSAETSTRPPGRRAIFTEIRPKGVATRRDSRGSARRSHSRRAHAERGASRRAAGGRARRARRARHSTRTRKPGRFFFVCTCWSETSRAPAASSRSITWSKCSGTRSSRLHSRHATRSCRSSGALAEHRAQHVGKRPGPVVAGAVADPLAPSWRAAARSARRRCAGWRRRSASPSPRRRRRGRSARRAAARGSRAPAAAAGRARVSTLPWPRATGEALTRAHAEALQRDRRAR